MKEIALCFLLIVLLFLLFTLFGKLAAAVFQIQTSGILTLLFGVFAYYGLFQILALPMILCKQPLSRLGLLWMIVLAAVLVSATFILRKQPRTHTFSSERAGLIAEAKQHPFSVMVILLMLLIMTLQFYYVITNPYLGWDTSSYVGTIATSVERNSMYLFDGENGKAAHYINFRYALSSFYMHSAIWCRLLHIRPLYFAKIVQGGICSILSGMVIYQLGLFLFSSTRYEKTLSRLQRYSASAGMLIAATLFHVFFQSIYSTSDFLLSRGLEAKGYCANIVLPSIFLYGIMLWRDSKSRDTWCYLFMACFSSVALSMSSLVTAPALAVLMVIPVILRTRKLSVILRFLICMLPNVCYLLLYVVHVLRIFRIGV